MKLRNTVTGVVVDVPSTLANELLGAGRTWVDAAPPARKRTTAKKPPRPTEEE